MTVADFKDSTYLYLCISAGLEIYVRDWKAAGGLMDR